MQQGSNLRPTEPQSAVLPTELCTPYDSPGIPLTFRRSTPVGLYRLTLVERRGFEPLLLDFGELCSRLGSNQRPSPRHGDVLPLNYRNIKFWFSRLDLNQRSLACDASILDQTKLQENKCPATLKEPCANRYLAGCRNTPQLIGTCSSAWWCSLLCSRLDSNQRSPECNSGIQNRLNGRSKEGTNGNL